VDQITDQDDALQAYRSLKQNRKISESNYIKALAKCSKALKEYARSAKKTPIGKDLQDLMKKEYSNQREKTIIQFSFSQKKLIYNQVKLFTNRVIKELRKDIFETMRKNYI
jgi:hypothetical protein